MVILVYLNSALLECDSESKDTIIKTKLTVDKTSRLVVFYKKSVLRNLAKFIGKNLCWSLLLTKLKASVLQLYQRLQYRCFPVKFVKYLRVSIICRMPEDSCVFIESYICYYTTNRFFIRFMGISFKHEKISILNVQ